MDENAEEKLFFNTNLNDPLGGVDVFKKMTKVQKMLVYGEKSASHCMTVKIP